MNTKPLKDLMDRKLDRRQFLIFIGGALLIISGYTGIMSRLREGLANARTQAKSGSTYGGGSRRNRNDV